MTAPKGELLRARRPVGGSERSLTARKGISPAEFATQMGVSTASALRACREKRVRCVRFGKRIIIPADEADRLLGGELAD
jgi:hypothetical protein